MDCYYHVKATADVFPGIGSMIIRLVCPICKRAIPYSEIQDHISLCLQEVFLGCLLYHSLFLLRDPSISLSLFTLPPPPLSLSQEYVKEPLSASVQMIHSLCTDTTRRKNCIDTLCKSACSCAFSIIWKNL